MTGTFEPSYGQFISYNERGPVLPPRRAGAGRSFSPVASHPVQLNL